MILFGNFRFNEWNWKITLKIFPLRKKIQFTDVEERAGWVLKPVGITIRLRTWLRLRHSIRLYTVKWNLWLVLFLHMYVTVFKMCEEMTNQWTKQRMTAKFTPHSFLNFSHEQCTFWHFHIIHTHVVYTLLKLKYD